MRRLLLAIGLAAAPLFADEIHLRGGGKLTGEIVEQTPEAVTIDIGAGKMTVKMATVVGIDKGTSPLQEYRERAARIADNDVQGWRELARWATEKGLSAQAHDAYTRVHTALPDDADANRALGLVLHEGKWVTEDDSYRARGYVEFEGAWMTPAERNAIVQERRTREEADRQAIAADVRKSEEERKQREAEEARQAEERFRGNELPTLGDPVYWGSTYYAPAVWPAQPIGSRR